MAVTETSGSVTGQVTREVGGEFMVLDEDTFVVLANGGVVQAGDMRPGDVAQSLATDAQIAASQHDSGVAQAQQEQPAAPTGGGAASAGTTPSAAADLPTAHEGMAGVPPGGKLWRIDGRVYWGREILDPDSRETVGFAGWYVSDTEELDTLLAGGALEFAFDGTLADAEGRGFIDGGQLEEVQGVPGEDPLETFYEDWAEQLSLSPMYDNPEVLELAVVAALEGREITGNELAQTEWWQGSNDAQRAWAELVASNPGQAAIVQSNNRESVRAQFWEMGYTDVPDSLVDYVADQWTSGTISAADAQRQVARETDPYAPGASPYAGLDLDALGWTVVRDSEGQLYFDTGEGYHLIDGPGGRARYEDQAVDLAQAPEGRFVSMGGTEYFVSPEGEYYITTGPGQAAGLRRLYGEPEVIEHYGRGVAVAGTVVDYFGGPGGIEKLSSGEIVSSGSAADLARGAERLDTTALGEEERVRELLRQYVGPYHAANYSDSWVAQWAGKIRNGGPGEIDLLVQDLQRDFSTLFPGYDGNNLSYESVAGPSRGLWSRYSGNEVDEDDTAWLSFLGQGPDAANREGWLRAYGRQQGWAPTVGQASEALQVLGSQVVRGLV